MAERELDDGVRIAQLLASELAGHGGSLAAVTVGEAEREVEPTAEGRRAYVVRVDGRPLATVYVHPDRARTAFHAARSVVRAAAADADLRVASDADVLVRNGAEVKRVLRVVEAAVRAVA